MLKIVMIKEMDGRAVAVVRTIAAFDLTCQLMLIAMMPILKVPMTLIRIMILLIVIMIWNIDKEEEEIKEKGDVKMKRDGKGDDILAMALAIWKMQWEMDLVAIKPFVISVKPIVLHGHIIVASAIVVYYGWTITVGVTSFFSYS
jgi:hypothetical protein